MAHVVIVEDENASVWRLKDYLEQYEKEYQETFKTTVFHDGLEILDAYSPDFDIILMDIMLPHLDGMKTAKRIREKDSEVVIIFITNMANYAIHGYEVNALDFVVKPVKYFQFALKLKKALETVRNKKEKFLFLPVDGEKRKVSVRDIYYLETYNHNLYVHTRDSVIEFYGTLQAMEKELESSFFVRCHSGYLVNLYHVTSYRDEYVVVGEERIPISRPKKKVFLKAVMDYIGKGLAK